MGSVLLCNEEFLGKIHLPSRCIPRTVVGSSAPHMVCGVLSVSGEPCDCSMFRAQMAPGVSILILYRIFPLPEFEIYPSSSQLCCLVFYVHFAAFCVIFHVTSMPSYENDLSFAVLRFRGVSGFLNYTVFSLFERLLLRGLFFPTVMYSSKDSMAVMHTSTATLLPVVW